jgi:hypothetical protein
MFKKGSFFSMAIQSFWVRFGSIWFFLGLPFLIIGIYTGIQTMTQQERFQKEGQSTQGMVLTKSIQGGKKSSNESYQFTYRFSTADGKVVMGEASVSLEIWDRLEERGPVQVTYLPDKPQSNRVEGKKVDWMLPIAFLIVGGILTSLGGFVLVKALRQIGARSAYRERHNTNQSIIV